MDINLNVEKEDIAVIKKAVAGKLLPLELDFIVTQVALFKTQGERKNRVKRYNPRCEYKVDDLIYKEYSSKIPIGSKKYVELQRGVVLKVDELRSRPGIEEIKLSYDGTSIFRKYIAYLDRQKIDLLLPHKRKKPYDKAEYLEDEMDPRLQNDPLIERDFHVLKKKVISYLQKSNDIAFSNNKVMLFENVKEIKADVFNRIREFLSDNKKSVSTEFLVENFLKVKPGTDDFTSYCFSINYIMSTDYKIDFQQTVKSGWGKWNMISVVYHQRKDSILSLHNPVINTASTQNEDGLKQRRKVIINDFFDNDKTKCILTQREITAGAVRVKSGLFDFGSDLEFEIMDTKTKKMHTFYYYRDVELLIGFKEIFQATKALQGMSISFSKNSDNIICFSIKEVKKGTIADEIIYDNEKKAFTSTYKKIASPVFVNKAFFLETEVFTTLYNDFESYTELKSFNKLVHKIFLNFGKREKNYEIHAFRLYHILDLIYPTSLQTVLNVLLGNPEFIPSDKLSGVFYLDSTAVTDIEADEVKSVVVPDEEVIEQEPMEIKAHSDEEMEKLDAIRQKREERRIKRENEMRLKEELNKQKLTEEKLTDSAKPSKPEPFSKPDASVGFAEPMPVEKKPKVKEVPKKQAPVGDDVEKTPKAKKRIETESEEDRINIEDIKKDIKLEELKEEVLSKKEKAKKEKEKEVAYQDNGAFGGIFASKLDEAVLKKDDNDTDE